MKELEDFQKHSLHLGEDVFDLAVKYQKTLTPPNFAIAVIGALVGAIYPSAPSEDELKELILETVENSLIFYRKKHKEYLENE